MLCLCRERHIPAGRCRCEQHARSVEAVEAVSRFQSTRVKPYFASDFTNVPHCGSLRMVCPCCGRSQHLLTMRRYRLRAAVDIDDVSEEQQVWVRFGAQPQRQAAPSGQLAGQALGAESKMLTRRVAECCC